VTAQTLLATSPQVANATSGVPATCSTRSASRASRLDWPITWGCIVSTYTPSATFSYIQSNWFRHCSKTAASSAAARPGENASGG
jgi:hypothetical protein